MLSMRVPLAAVLLGGVGCATVQPVREPAQFIPRTNPELVLVVYNDNSEVPVAKPHMSGDTLIGTWAGLGESVVVPLSNVQRIDAVQRDKKRTTLAIAGLTAFTAGMVYAITQLGGGSNPACDYSGATKQVPAGCPPCSAKGGVPC